MIVPFPPLIDSRQISTVGEKADASVGFPKRAGCEKAIVYE